MIKDNNGEYLNSADDFKIVQNVIQYTTGLRTKPNYLKVQKILLQGTTHAGMTSSIQKCRQLGVDPYGTKWERKAEPNGTTYYDRECWELYSDSVAEVPIRMRWHDLGLDGVKKLCPVCGSELKYSYHEDRLYSIYCPRCKIVTMVRESSPTKAAIAMGAKI